MDGADSSDLGRAFPRDVGHLFRLMSAGVPIEGGRGGERPCLKYGSSSVH